MFIYKLEQCLFTFRVIYLKPEVDELGGIAKTRDFIEYYKDTFGHACRFFCAASLGNSAEV